MTVRYSDSNIMYYLSGNFADTTTKWHVPELDDVAVTSLRRAVVVRGVSPLVRKSAQAGDETRLEHCGGGGQSVVHNTTVALSLPTSILYWE